MVFTVQQTLDALEEIVKEKGEDYVYEDAGYSCTYTTLDGAPSCIVGHLFARLTPDIFETIKENEWDENEYGQAYPHIAGITSVDEVYGVGVDGRFDEDSLVVLAEAQNTQDHLETWGDALAVAKYRAERLEVMHND